ncbi:hypothetical protein MJT46_005787 [Ovis ammon polii x Ovis aries]|nr:hypothetical protein MJT46_005787 [Ovis ammon polii x Ovis aries]
MKSYLPFFADKCDPTQFENFNASDEELEEAQEKHGLPMNTQSVQRSGDWGYRLTMKKIWVMQFHDCQVMKQQRSKDWRLLSFLSEIKLVKQWMLCTWRCNKEEKQQEDAQLEFKDVKATKIRSIDSSTIFIISNGSGQLHEDP